MPRNFRELIAQLPAENRGAIAKHTAAVMEKMALHDLRRARRKTQMETAERMGVAQSEVSRIETRSETKLGTLQDYVRALGGELELHAVFPEATITLELTGRTSEKSA